MVELEEKWGGKRKGGRADLRMRSEGEEEREEEREERKRMMEMDLEWIDGDWWNKEELVQAERETC